MQRSGLNVPSQASSLQICSAWHYPSSLVLGAFTVSGVPSQQAVEAGQGLILAGYPHGDFHVLELFARRSSSEKWIQLPWPCCFHSVPAVALQWGLG